MFVLRTRLLEILESRDYINFGNQDHDWGAIIDTCEKAVVDNPQYWTNLVPDNPEIWDRFGDQYFQGIKRFKDWGYTSTNTASWETTAVQPQLKMEWESSVVKKLPLSDAVSRPTLQKPGNICPWHEDKFHLFKRQHQEHKEFIVRFIVFINDWTPGQFIQAGNSVIKEWQAGDTVLWHPKRMHLSVNAGYDNKWTTNITGVLDEKIELPHNIAKDLL